MSIESWLRKISLDLSAKVVVGVLVALGGAAWAWLSPTARATSEAVIAWAGGRATYPVPAWSALVLAGVAAVAGYAIGKPRPNSDPDLSPSDEKALVAILNAEDGGIPKEALGSMLELSGAETTLLLHRLEARSLVMYRRGVSRRLVLTGSGLAYVDTRPRLSRDITFREPSRPNAGGRYQ